MHWVGRKNLLGCFILWAAVAAAQPVVEGGGVVNAASYALAGLPNSSIAQGSIFAVFGRAMGPATLQQAGFPLPTQLAGTSVKVTVGGQTVDALMLYTSATQLACVLPSRTPLGTGTLQVIYNTQPSNPAPITVAPVSFGIFTANQAGNGPGRFTDGDNRVNELSWSARPNEVLAVWGTGLGAVSFPESQGAPSEDMKGSDAEVYVGFKKAEVLFRGRAPRYSGLDQINFRVPPGVEGCYVPVAVKAGAVVSNFVTLSISSGKRTCTDAMGLSDAEIDQAKSKNDFRLGSVVLSKYEISLPPLPGSPDSSIRLDSGDADFVRYDFGKLAGSRGASQYVPAGHCVVYQFRGQSPDFPDPVVPAGLDAGNLSVSGPRGTKQFKLDSRGHYSAELGWGGVPGLPGGEEYLVRGSYTVTATGGADVRAFTATLTLPEPLRWMNKSEVNVIARSRDLAVTWTGGNPAQEYVLIVGFSLKAAPDAGAAFLCTERAAAGSFTVPSLVLSALPESQAGGGLTGIPTGVLTVGTAPLMEPSKFRAQGLDAGYFHYAVLSGKSVTYQ